MLFLWVKIIFTCLNNLRKKSKAKLKEKTHPVLQQLSQPKKGIKKAEVLFGAAAKLLKY